MTVFSLRPEDSFSSSTVWVPGTEFRLSGLLELEQPGRWAAVTPVGIILIMLTDTRDPSCWQDHPLGRGSQPKRQRRQTEH
ncbi:hypothetical protein LEMLEM_LOCUS23330 [Lemmus lemmus]